MSLTTELWCDIVEHLDYDTDVQIAHDPDGLTWRRHGHAALRPAGTMQTWWPEAEDEIRIAVSPIPEPPDGTRIEFTHGGQGRAAWRDNGGATRKGWRADQGWHLPAEAVPCSWAVMWLRFGESLRDAVRLEKAR